MVDAQTYLAQNFKPINNPLVDCITNRVTIETMANSLIALGASPIMADYEPELADILAQCQAILLNMGQLSSGAIAALQTGLELAHDLHIPSVLDLVGFGASQVRRDLGTTLVAAKPTIVKGNYSEIRGFLNLPQHGQGVDASAADQTQAAMAEVVAGLKPYLAETTFLLTGPQDLIVSAAGTWVLTNNAPELTGLTGMGDVVGAFAAAFASTNPPEIAAMAAVSYLNVAAQQAEQLQSRGLGSFKVALHDQLDLNKTHAWLDEVEGYQWTN